MESSLARTAMPSFLDLQCCRQSLHCADLVQGLVISDLTAHSHSTAPPTCPLLCSELRRTPRCAAPRLSDDSDLRVIGVQTALPSTCAVLCWSLLAFGLLIMSLKLRQRARTESNVAVAVAVAGRRRGMSPIGSLWQPGGDAARGRPDREWPTTMVLCSDKYGVSPSVQINTALLGPRSLTLSRLIAFLALPVRPRVLRPSKRSSLYHVRDCVICKFIKDNPSVPSFNIDEESFTCL